MTKHLTKAELEAGLPHIFDAPKDNGVLEAIVIRPAEDERQDLESCEISLEGGTHGDRWVQDSHRHTEDGRSHPDVQICIMSARCIALIAGERERWPLAGDNLFIDIDTSPENLPTGQRLSIGSAVIEVTEEPHHACGAFVERYGREAAAFCNVGVGKANRFRGLYGRVVRDGRVTVGDRVVKTESV